MISGLKKLLSLFGRRERWRFAGVLGAVIVMGFVQIAGVGSIIPFVSLLVDRNVVHENYYLALMYDTLGFTEINSFLFFIGIVVVVVLVVGNLFTAFTIWLLARFAWDSQVRLSRQLLHQYLLRPYSYFLNRNSSEIGKNILLEVSQLCQGVLMPSLNIVAFGMTALFIVGFLLWLNPLLTAIAAGLFAVSYGVIYVFIRRPLERLGQTRLRVNTERFKAVGEAFGSVKEVKILKREASFVDRYTTAAKVFAQTLIRQQVFGMLPRYIIETVAFSLLMAVLLYLLHIEANLQQVIPMATAFAYAAYRLLPIMQKIFMSASALRYNRAVLDVLHMDLTEVPVPPTAENTSLAERRLPFVSEIRLEGISYTYPSAPRPSLHDINMRVPHRSFVALVGATGAGKTTLVDILLGLLQPQAGRMAVDEREITEAKLASWQANLGYVPQSIFLTDDTVAANIAFGLPTEKIDDAAVERAAKLASIHTFVTEKLPHGYDTVVGERGVRLSGGERQRIGIARALYHDPDVLVLDEATSALDSATEAAVHAAIVQTAEVKTVIVIAHRLATVRDCDCIYVLRGGHIVASGTYDNLLSDNGEFRRIAYGLQEADSEA